MCYQKYLHIKNFCKNKGLVIRYQLLGIRYQLWGIKYEASVIIPFPQKPRKFAAQLPCFILFVPGLINIMIGANAENIAATLSIYKKHLTSTGINCATLTGNKNIRRNLGNCLFIPVVSSQQS